MMHDLITVAHITAWHVMLILFGMLPLRRYLPKCGPYRHLTSCGLLPR